MNIKETAQQEEMFVNQAAHLLLDLAGLKELPKTRGSSEIIEGDLFKLPIKND